MTFLGIGRAGRLAGGRGGRSGPLRAVLPAAMALAFVPGFFWPSYEFVERNDGGFHYKDYPGSPYQQRWVPDPAINQIQCPPPARPRCGD